MLYVYGMRLRPWGMGCQPDGYVPVMAFRRKGFYHGVIAYRRRLTDEEEDHYDLDLLGEVSDTGMLMGFEEATARVKGRG